MEDSSSNPYIPGESEQIRQKVYERQSPLGKVVKWSLIATVVIAVLVGAALFFVIPRTTAVDQPARTKLADALQPPDQTLKRVPVASDLGFKLSYDNRVYSSYGEVGDSTSGSDSSAAVLSGETYENNQLRVQRAYNYVRIRPIESVEGARALATQPPEFEFFATMTDKDLVDAAANAENKGLPKLSLFVKLDTDKRLAKRVGDDKTIVTINASKPVSTTIGDTEYQKVRFTTTNDNYRIANVRYDDCYYTIQNDVPYSVCISNVRPTSVSAASLVEQVFDSIAYEQPASSGSEQTDTEKTSYALPLARLAQATTADDEDAAATSDEEESGEAPLLTVTPAYYADAGSLAAIAKNQPSVVRIGTLYCANLALKLESGETATTLSDACVGNVATGAFVSSDGHVATSGHAIRAQKKAAISGYINFAPDQTQMLDRLQRVLDYLLKIKKILQSDADYIKTGAQIGDQEALAKVENIASVIPDDYITPINEEYTYAVQPTDKPIVVNRSDSNKPAFAYSDSVLKAKYVASDYDASTSVQSEFGSATPKTDVGLIKAEEAGEYPAVPIADAENMKANETLNTIGYPAYTDSSLTIDKIRNIPVVTVSKVEQAYEKEGTRLIQTNTPVLPGNDGAPVVDASGQLVGLAVYGFSYCPDQLCFGNGTVRSATELQKLIAKNNVKLNLASTTTASWRDGVDQYFKANYAASGSAFANAADYQFNRWAEPLQKLAVSLKGSEKDTSLMNQVQLVMIIVLIISGVLTVILAILYILHRTQIRRMQVGHYGAAEVVQPVTPAVAPQAPVSALPPVQPTQSSTQTVYPPAQPQAGGQPQAPYQAPGAPTQPQVPQQPPQTPPEDPFYK